MIQPSGHPAEAYKEYFNAATDEVKQTVFTGRGNAAAVYLQVFNKLAASVTVGTTAPDYTLLVPQGAVVQMQMPAGAFKHLATGCVIAVTAARTTADAPGADATVHIHYRTN
jgi:hypothetical protein